MKLVARIRMVTATAGMMLGLVVAASARGRVVDFTRHLDIYYGTWDVLVQGNPTPIATQTFVEFSDHISDGLRLTIQADPAADARVDAASPLWVFPPDLTNIEWVTGTPELLPAVANFDAAIAALGGTVTGDTGFQLVTTQTYLLDSFDVDGVPNNFKAEVSYVERNGSVTLTSLGQCPLGHGYWKNKTTTWPVTSLTLGALSYSQSELGALLGNPSNRDASVILARQLIAAKLNILNGADASPVVTAVAQADALFGATHLPSGVPAASVSGQAMVALARVLDDYNSGRLTPICQR